MSPELEQRLYDAFPRLFREGYNPEPALLPDNIAVECTLLRRSPIKIGGAANLPAPTNAGHGANMPKPMRMLYQRLREQHRSADCIHIEKHNCAERTLNQIRREERKDVYFVHFSNADGWSANVAVARNHLLQWLKENLPDTPTEVLSPISIFRVDPKLADIRIDFDAAGLAKFSAEWEDPDGSSRDPYFQCYIESFADWRAEIAGSMPSFDRPMTTTDCWFWDTPKGFLHHLDSATDKSSVFNLGNLDDIWFLAGELVPEWRDVDTAEFVAGRIHYHMAEQQWRVYIGLVGFKHNAYSHFQRNDDYRLNPENQRRICEWFRLPPERVVFEEYDYF